MRTDIDRVVQAVQGMPWAILPAKLAQLEEVLALRAAGVEFTAEEIGARLGAAPAKRGAGQTAGGVAVIPLFGVISYRMNMLSAMSGGTSLERFMGQLDAAAANPDIATIVVDGDSPGGSVLGIPEAAAKIREARAKKEVIFVANGMLASAAYWLASQASSVVVTPSGEVGSIGVFAMHVDTSAADQKAGITRTLVRAGKYKAEGHPAAPLTDEARAHMQDQIDEFYAMFVDDVAQGRGTSPDAVRNGYGEGRTVLAKAAVQEGMADRVASLEQVLADLGITPAQLAAARGSARAEVVVEKRASVGTTDAGLAEITAALANVEGVARMENGIRIYLPDDAGPDAIERFGKDLAALVESRSGVVVHQVGQGMAGVPEAASAEANHAPITEPAPGARSNTVDPNKDTAATPSAGAATPTVTVGEDHSTAQRAAEVTMLCGMHGISADRVAAFISAGKTAGDVARELFEERRRDLRPSTPPAPRGAVDMESQDRRRYSIASAIAQAAGLAPRGLETEVSDALDASLPKGWEGGAGAHRILIPTYGLAPSAAGNDTKTTGKGAELVFTEEGDFIDRLRNRAMVLRLGATYLPGLTGDYAEPRLDGDASAAWLGENPGADAAESELATGQVKLTPKQLVGSVPFSRLLFRQSHVNVEDRVRDSLAKVHALAIDLAGLHGTGAANDPKGVYSATGINAVAFGGAVTFAKAIEMESAIAADNADIGAMAYLVTPEVRGVAKQTKKDVGSGLFLYNGAGDSEEMNGYRAAATNQLSKVLGAGTNEHGIVFGVWSEMLIGEWGFLELIVDPFSLARRGMIRVTSYQAADIQFRHPEAFCKGTGLTAA